MSSQFLYPDSRATASRAVFCLNFVSVPSRACSSDLSLILFLFFWNSSCTSCCFLLDVAHPSIRLSPAMCSAARKPPPYTPSYIKDCVHNSFWLGPKETIFSLIFSATSRGIPYSTIVFAAFSAYRASSHTSEVAPRPISIPQRNSLPP